MLTKKLDNRKLSKKSLIILIVTHETPFSESFSRRTKWDLKQINFFNYSLGLTLSNKYLEVIVKFFELEILIEKIDVLFDLLILKNKLSIYQEKSINFN